MSDVSRWLWPALSLLLAALWLWTLLRQRREATAAPRPEPGSKYDAVEAEDALKAAYLLQRAGTWGSEVLARDMELPRVLADRLVGTLVRCGWVTQSTQGTAQLTEKGRERARELIRAHRLWERYLVDREGMPLAAVHREAHRREHETTTRELEELDAELEQPAWDPHGHIIPAATKSS